MNIPELGDNATLFATIIGFLLPALVAFINRSTWSSETKGVVALISSIAAGAGTAYFAGLWNTEDILRTVMIVLIVSQIAYQTWWRGSGISTKIEDAT